MFGVAAVLLALVAACLCAAAGIASFLAVGRPGGGRQTVGLEAALPLVTSLAGVLAVCLVAAKWGPRRYRAIWLAIACGTDFGVTAFLLKITPDTLAQGFDPLRAWPLYLLIIVGPLGFLLNQSAFQAGVLIAPVLAIITALDPLASIGIARVWLDESFASSPPALAAEALSLTVMTGGIVALAYRAPQVARKKARAGSDERRSTKISEYDMLTPNRVCQGRLVVAGAHGSNVAMRYKS